MPGLICEKHGICTQGHGFHMQGHVWTQSIQSLHRVGQSCVITTGLEICTCRVQGNRCYTDVAGSWARACSCYSITLLVTQDNFESLSSLESLLWQLGDLRKRGGSVTQGHDLHMQGHDLHMQGHNLHMQGHNLHMQGHDLHMQSHNLHMQGHNITHSGSRFTHYTCGVTIEPIFYM